MTRKISVGSTSPVKMRAVESACRSARLDAEVIGVEAESGVNVQPVGCEEMKRGARNRAEAALAAHPDSVAIGIENGLINCGRLWYDEAAICLLCPNGACLEAKSEPVQFPGWAVHVAQGRGFDRCTVGQVLFEDRGWDPSDPHSEITLGQASRQSLIARALAPLIERVALGYCD